MNEQKLIYTVRKNSVDLNNLPKRIFQGKETINWKVCEKEKVPFVFQSIKGELLITFNGYLGKASKPLLLVEYNGKTYESDANLLKNCSLRNIVYDGNFLIDDVYARKFLVNPENYKKVKKHSKTKVKCMCPNCGFQKYTAASYITNKGFNCPKCTNNISYPEKVMMLILDYNEIEYEREKIFFNAKKFRFDFYIPSLNVVIETNGDQHYNDIKGAWESDTFKNDKLKKEYCKNNEILFLEIDCRKSDLAFILESIDRSEIKNIIKIPNYNYMIENIFEYSVYKNARDIVKDYLNGMNYFEIEDKYDISYFNVPDLMKRMGVYKKRGKNNRKKSIICLNNNKYFDTCLDASKYAGVSTQNNLIKVCKGTRKHAGKHPETGEPLKWMYYEDYVNQQKHVTI